MHFLYLLFGTTEYQVSQVNDVHLTMHTMLYQTRPAPFISVLILVCISLVLLVVKKDQYGHSDWSAAAQLHMHQAAMQELPILYFKTRKIVAYFKVEQI